jgi:CHAT domain-containing protein
VAATVVLSACAVGDVDANAAGGGLNLASVLLLRGAQRVVAPTVPVSDAGAATYSRALYRALPGPGGEHLPRAHAAGLAAARAVTTDAGAPDPAWTAFRLWTR